MNLAIRGIAGNLGEKAADTFADDQHKDLKADFIMANPPFNQKDWRAETELKDDPRWMGYDVPPKSNANYGWILNMASKLSDNGMAGFILANGALSGGGEEYKIRRKLIENNLVEAILVLPRNLFYTTDISVTLWILNKNKTAQSKNIGDVKRQLRNREKEILFMDLRQMGEPFEKKFTQFSEADIKKVAETFHNWQQGIMVNEKSMVNDEGLMVNEKSKSKSMVNDKGLMVNEKGDNNINNLPFTINNYNVPEFCYSASLEEIAAKDFSLVPSKYIEFVNRDENIDFDEKMTRRIQVINATPSLFRVAF